MTIRKGDLHKGVYYDFIAERWPGKNTSGFTPYGVNVLIRMDRCAAKRGNILIPDENVERQNAASTSGCIYAMGPAAFRRFADGFKWDGERPQIGDRVWVAPYSGIECLGVDGGLYRLMDHNCIYGGLDVPHLRVIGETA